MTSIKTPGGPGGIQNPTAPTDTTAPAKPAGASFQERVEKASTARAAEATRPQTTEGVLAELRAGKLPPDQAVSQLTDLAMQRNHVVPALRPQVEQRIRDWMANDPLVRDLLRQMGASVPRDE